MAERFLGQGAEGRVFVEGKRVRKQAKQYLGEAPMFNPLKVFYAHKIADALFPGTVLQYDLARRKVGDEPAIVKSHWVETTPEHKAYADWYCAVKSYPKPPEAEEHGTRVRSEEVQKVVYLMHEKGVNVDPHPSNIGFVNGKPFFFEVVRIDPDRLVNAIAEHPKKKLLEKYLERYDKAKEEGAIYEPKKRR